MFKSPETLFAEQGMAEQAFIGLNASHDIPWLCFRPTQRASTHNTLVAPHATAVVDADRNSAGAARRSLKNHSRHTLFII